MLLPANAQRGNVLEGSADTPWLPRLEARGPELHIVSRLLWRLPRDPRNNVLQDSLGVRALGLQAPGRQLGLDTLQQDALGAAAFFAGTAAAAAVPGDCFRFCCVRSVFHVMGSHATRGQIFENLPPYCTSPIPTQYGLRFWPKMRRAVLLDLMSALTPTLAGSRLGLSRLLLLLRPPQEPD